MKKLIKKYNHLWTTAYVLIYMPWFMWLERTITPSSEFHNMYVPFDDMIPFNEWFVIPYLLWFLYVPVVMGFLALKSKEEYYNASIYLFGGMTICLFICTVWPNGQTLRIADLDINKNILTKAVGLIYHADTNTNVFPSIHSFNSVAVFMMLFKSRFLTGKARKPVLICSGILSGLIVISTLVLKQHSVLDAIGGVGLAFIMYSFVYIVNWKSIFANDKKKNKTSDNKATGQIM